MNKKIYIGLLIVVVLGVALYATRNQIMPKFFEPTETVIEEGELNTEIQGPEVVLENLNIPWELTFLPSGEMLLTERGGRLLLVGESKDVIEIGGVTHRGEGGLLGLALHPDFEDNNFVYLYLTTGSLTGLSNRVERYRLVDKSLTDRTVIIENIPGAIYHDGGRIAFGPDKMLYVATGDAGNKPSAQDKNTLAGKILRLNDDGSIPSDNPFGNAVYSYGHRNVQGLAWDSEGNLWATEHGQSSFDELNKIEKGGNFGWPNIQGDQSAEGMIRPQAHSGASETWAPAGMAFLDGHIIFAGLRGQSLYATDVSDGSAKDLTNYLRSEFGRLRSVTIGPDNMLYIFTNNRDGRGNPISTDDRIIKIDPRMFNF